MRRIFFVIAMRPNLALLEAFAGRIDFRIPSIASGAVFGGHQPIPDTVSLAAGLVGPPRAVNMVSGPFHVIVRGALMLFSLCKRGTV